MVMVDDERVRANRLALLRDLLSEFSTIADFSEIVTEGSRLNVIRHAVKSERIVIRASENLLLHGQMPARFDLSFAVISL